ADLPNGSTVDYLIDARNRRVGRQLNGVVTQRWVYQDQLKPIAELDATGNLVSVFLFGSSAYLPDAMVHVADGKLYRFIADHVGSVRLVVDTATGAAVQHLEYDEFGNVLADSNPGFQPFGFAGGLYDHDTGLVRFGARDYDPKTGRWTTKDP